MTEALRGGGEDLFRRVVRRARDGIIITDALGTIVEWNDGEESLTGVSRAEAVGRPIWEIQHRLVVEERRTEEFRERARARTLSALKEGAHLQRELEDEIQRPDGERRAVQSVLFPIESDGELFAVGVSRDITSSKLADERLRVSGERLSLALEASEQGIWDWDIVANTAYLSPEYLRLTGYSQSEVRSALEFFHSTIHPADLSGVESTMWEHLRGRSPRSVIEYRLKKPSGEYMWIRGVGKVTARSASGEPLRMTGVIADITESRRLEEELRERQALLVEAERIAHLGHWDRDLRSGRAHWSDEIYRILGFSPGSVIPGTESFLSAIVPEDRERVSQATGATMRDGMSRCEEYRVTTGAGTSKYVVGVVELLRDAAGGPARLIGTAQDISERKAMEDSLAEANRRKDEFLAMLSHELRNPLAPIRSSLYVLARTDPGGDQARRMLAVVERQVTQLTRLVDDLLDATRLARGKIRLQRERLEMGALVRRTVEDHRSAFTANAVQCEERLTSRPLWLDADETRIAQLISNLLGNAAKFTNPGDRVEVALQREGADAVLRVTDTGIGIPREMLGQVFEPFRQAEQRSDRSRGGLGLGLALVKGLAELHGGSVTAASEGPGRGAQFTVRLPLLEAPAAVVEALPVVRAVQPRRVLIIEDSADAAGSLQEALQLDGHEVEVAHNGAEGLVKARAFRPEVLLCDIGLPGMNGYDVARAFRSDDMLRDTFLVALTGYALPEDLQRARQAGFDRHLAKPVALEALASLLDEAGRAGEHGPVEGPGERRLQPM